MSMPSPFELGRAIGGNIGGALQGASDTGNINKILQQSAQANDAQNMDNVIGQILQRVSPQNQEAAFKMLQQQKNDILAKQQRDSRQKYYKESELGEEFINLPDKEREIILQNKFKPVKGQEELETARDLILSQMERITSGHLGPIFGGPGVKSREWGSTTSPEGKATRASFKEIGKMLISMSSSMPIKNREQFKILAEKLYDPTLDVNELKGTYEALLEKVDAALSNKKPKTTKSSSSEEVVITNDKGEELVLDETRTKWVPRK